MFSKNSLFLFLEMTSSLLTKHVVLPFYLCCFFLRQDGCPTINNKLNHTLLNLQRKQKNLFLLWTFFKFCMRAKLFKRGEQGSQLNTENEG